MATRKLYQLLATHLNAMENCRESGNDEWLDKHSDMVATLVKQYLPSGSGFDSGTDLDFDESKGGTRLVFNTSYHHMDDNGMYDGWTDHTVTIKPDLALNFSLSVGGRNKRDIKDYIAEAFHCALTTELEPDMESGNYRLAA